MRYILRDILPQVLLLLLARSKGGRLHSAIIAIKKNTKEKTNGKNIISSFRLDIIQISFIFKRLMK